ncbi:MAG: DUF5069 domain-containing protein [Chthoniobacteraceae bacterium]
MWSSPRILGKLAHPELRRRSSRCPHIYSVLVTELAAAFGRSQMGIDFGAVDDAPVELILLLILPESAMQKVNRVRLMARIAQALADRTQQEKLRGCLDAAEIANVLRAAFGIGSGSDHLILPGTGARSTTTPHQRSLMKIEGIKGCYAKTGGLFYFARMCSKIRLHAEGKLPEDYFSMLGQGFDGRTCRYLGVTYDLVRDLVVSGKNDEEVLEACYEAGRRLTDEEVLIYNSFMSKRGWRDDETAEYIPQLIKEYGFPDDGSVVTDFDVIEMDEGRWYPEMWKAGWAEEKR